MRVQDVMSRDLILIGPDQPGCLAGIITLHDLMSDRVLQQPRGAAALAALRVADLMTRDVSTARRYQPLYDLVAAFSDGGLHHMPVMDGEQLVGILTQWDMVAALFTLALQPVLAEADQGAGG